MPRYKFRWTNLPQGVLRALTAGEGVRLTDAPEQLRDWYGARPNEEFVRDVWDVLRDSWLRRDTAARKAVVDRLWESGVGKGDTFPRNRNAEMDFLRSCRNARRLREAVLAEFIALGEQQRDELQARSEDSPRSEPRAKPAAPMSQPEPLSAEFARSSAGSSQVETLRDAPSRTYHPILSRDDNLAHVITGELKSKVDRVWDAFWSGGIANPLEVIEQITYLLFLRRLDELQTLAERKSARTSQPLERVIFKGSDDDRRWKNFKQSDPASMFETISEDVFPFLRGLGGEQSTYSSHMKDARFTIPTPALLSKVVDMLDDIPMTDRDTNGDLYEYMLSKIASAGQNGQFRTPRHIIALMVEMMAPTVKDDICDPACGTAGFLVAASEYLRRESPNLLMDAESSRHFNHSMFHGYDFDATMLRIGSMNMLLHGIEAPDIRYRDSLSDGASGDAELYSLVLANPPFAGSLDYESTAKDLQRVIKTKKTELLFLALFLRLLKTGGRAAVIVPDGVLFGSSKAHKELRRTLVEDHKLDGVVKLPGGVFKPYAGVSTAILLFTKTGVGGTDDVWFYEVTADGWSLDDKRTPLLDESKLGPRPEPALSEDEHAKNNLPDALARWRDRDSGERSRARTEQSFSVPKTDIAAQGYDLSLNRYKEISHDEVEHRPPLEIIADLERLEADTQQGLAELKAMLR